MVPCLGSPLRRACNTYTHTDFYKIAYLCIQLPQNISFRTLSKASSSKDSKVAKKQQIDNVSKQVIHYILQYKISVGPLQPSVKNLDREYHAVKLCPKHGCQTSMHASFQTQHYVWGIYLIFTIQMVTLQNVYSLGVGVDNSNRHFMLLKCFWGWESQYTPFWGWESQYLSICVRVFTLSYFIRSFQ